VITFARDLRHWACDDVPFRYVLDNYSVSFHRVGLFGFISDKLHVAHELA
jgi:hypothetical protein